MYYYIIIWFILFVSLFDSVHSDIIILNLLNNLNILKFWNIINAINDLKNYVLKDQFNLKKKIDSYNLSQY